MSNLSVSEVTERLQMSYQWVTDDGKAQAMFTHSTLIGIYNCFKEKPPLISEGWETLLFCDYDLFNQIALADGINHLEAFVHLAEAGMVTIQVSGIAPAVANEKL